MIEFAYIHKSALRWRAGRDNDRGNLWSRFLGQTERAIALSLRILPLRSLKNNAFVSVLPCNPEHFLPSCPGRMSTLKSPSRRDSKPILESSHNRDYPSPFFHSPQRGRSCSYSRRKSQRDNGERRPHCATCPSQIRPWNRVVKVNRHRFPPVFMALSSSGSLLIDRWLFLNSRLLWNLNDGY